LEYYNGSSWASVSLSDQTVLSSKTLAQSGKMTFTEPSDWQQNAAPVSGGGAQSLYWLRLRPAEVPTSAPIAIMVTKNKNALPAYGIMKG
jgi:hypothetical protein